MKTNEIKISILARNTLLNFIGQLVPLIIGVVALPFIIRGLGTDVFGILSLAWAVVGYFSLFDLGVGRATTKYVAEYLERKKQDKLPNVIWTALALHIFFGLCGGVSLALLTPILVGKLLNISPALVMDAQRVFFLLAIALPFVIFSGVLRGALEAGQRFDLTNAVRIPSSALNFLIPVVVLPLGFRLPEIVLLLVLARLGAAVIYLVLCLYVYPLLRKNIVLDLQMIRPLITFGWWVTISNLISPILVYFDRFLIGSLLSMAAVAYYTAPYEVVTRVSILPLSLVMVLFPLFSAIGNGSRKVLAVFYSRSIKYLLLIVGPLVMIMILFADDILQIWLGGEFAEKSILVFQILAIGVLANSLARVPHSFLQGLGRPDITAKFHLLELILYIPLLWFLLENMGIAGGALAWTLRVALDALLLFGASWKLYNMSPRILAENGLLRGVAVFAGLVGLLSATLLLSGSILNQAAITAMLIVLFALTAWHFVIDNKDREFIRSAIQRMGKGARDVK